MQHRPRGLRLAAIDLDGTLLDNESGVSERSVASLRSFIRLDGAAVVLASGQPPLQLLRNVAKLVGVEAGYCIASNGATVVWAPTGEVVYRDWVDSAALARLIPRIRELVPSLRLTVESTEGFVASNMDFFPMLDRLMPGTGARLMKTGRAVERLEEAFVDCGGTLTKAVRLLGLHPDSTKGSTDRLISALSSLVAAENAVHGSDLVLASPGGGEGAIHITPRGVDKAKALRWVCSKIGVTLEKVVAFGDHINDTTMLEIAGWGVAMGNAVENAKTVAQEVTRSNVDDGVARVLEEIVAAEAPSMAAETPNKWWSELFVLGVVAIAHGLDFWGDRRARL